MTGRRVGRATPRSVAVVGIVAAVAVREEVSELRKKKPLNM